MPEEGSVMETTPMSRSSGSEACIGGVIGGSGFIDLDDGRSRSSSEKRTRVRRRGLAWTGGGGGVEAGTGDGTCEMAWHRRCRRGDSAAEEAVGVEEQAETGRGESVECDGGSMSKRARGVGRLWMSMYDWTMGSMVVVEVVEMEVVVVVVVVVVVRVDVLATATNAGGRREGYVSRQSGAPEVSRDAQARGVSWAVG